jgi:hypothetical protein
MLPGEHDLIRAQTKKGHTCVVTPTHVIWLSRNRAVEQVPIQDIEKVTSEKAGVTSYRVTIYLRGLGGTSWGDFATLETAEAVKDAIQRAMLSY